MSVQARGRGRAPPPRALALAAAALAAQAVGCAEEGRGAGERAASLLPGPLLELRARTPGTLYLDVRADGVLLRERLPIVAEHATLVLGHEELGGRESALIEIDVEFVPAADAALARTIARLREAVSLEPGSTVTLSGLDYRYEDSDDDGLFDVHELAIAPSDVDADGVANVDDTDSDGDGTPDAEDPSPYGEGVDGRFGPLLAAIEIAPADGAGLTLPIDEIHGGSGEVRALAERGRALPLSLPPGWPAPPVELERLARRRWIALELETERAGGLCAEWPIALDTSSLRSTLSATGLLYFRRGAAERLVPLASARIENLDGFERSGPLDGDGPLNDALRVVLVPQRTVGWLELWTSATYTGERCALNVGADRAAAEP